MGLSEWLRRRAVQRPTTVTDQFDPPTEPLEGADRERWAALVQAGVDPTRLPATPPPPSAGGAPITPRPAG